MRHNKSPLLSLNRLETLTDGIFAIIITIMVLGIHVPTIPTNSSSMELFYALRQLTPQIISYSVSFYLIAHFWLSHIHQLKMCVCTNRTHILLIFMFIFFVSFIPFTTALVG
ncbi:MAG: TMEM175 family protein, partial [Caldisericia bacterium]|nr:TMEM175 family protein [Caldisericia bacterium]